MAQPQNKYRCKWCNTKCNTKEGCPDCREKLKLIKKIKAMLLGCSLEELENQNGKNNNNHS